MQIIIDVERVPGTVMSTVVAYFDGEQGRYTSKTMMGDVETSLVRQAIRDLMDHLDRNQLRLTVV